MITRIGCYLFGCDVGRPLGDSAPAWLKAAGTFPRWVDGTLERGSGSPAWVQHVKERGLSPDAMASLPVHPTQLYESLVGAGLLVFLLVARRHQKFRGEIFLLFTFSYGVCRYMLELLRDDAERGSIPPSLPEHVLLPLGLVIFAVAYAIGFSKVVRDPVVRKVTQALAFVPAVVMYLVYKPETFGTTTTQQYSTSQVVALTTGLAASIAFAIYYKAALDHPEHAMALRLPDAANADADGGDEADDEEDEDDGPGSERKVAAGSAKPAQDKRKKAKPEPDERNAAPEAPDASEEA
jgi:phosphatidylglycerol---prolipoprotein diacylglyceryl transferase